MAKKKEETGGKLYEIRQLMEHVLVDNGSRMGLNLEQDNVMREARKMLARETLVIINTKAEAENGEKTETE